MFSLLLHHRTNQMIEAQANGMKFTFPADTPQEVMSEMIDSYFGKETPETPEQRAARGISDYSSPLSEERLQRERELVSPEGKPWYAQPSAQVQSAKAVGDFFRYLGIGEGAETKSVEGVGKITRLDELGYQRDLGLNVARKAAMYLEAAFPSTKIGKDEYGRTTFESPEERYGKEVLQLPFQERLKFMQEDRVNTAREQNEMTAAVLDVAGEDEEMALAGRGITGVLDPALVPAVAISMAGIVPTLLAGGGYALSDEGTNQLLKNEADIDKLVQSAVIGTAFAAGTAPVRTAGLLYKGGIQAPARATEAAGKRLVNVVQNTRAVKGSTSTANSIVNKLEEKTAYHLMTTKLANGKPVTNKQASLLAQKDLNLTPQKMVDVFKHASKKPAYVTRENAAKIMAAKESPVAATSAIGRTWDKIGAPMVTAVRNIDEGIGASLRKMDMTHHINLANSMKQATPYLKQMMAASKSKDPLLKAQYTKLENALNDSKFTLANSIMKQHFPDLIEPFKESRKVLNTLYARARDAGIKISYLKNHNPRVVKDLEGLRAAAGIKQANAIDDALKAEATKKGLGSWTELDEVTASEVISNVIRFGGKRPPKALEAGRKYNTIPDHLRPFYHDTSTALQLYINRAEREIARHEFFGAKGVKDMDGNINLDGSIAKVLADTMKKKELTARQLDDLTLLLRARFNADNNAMGKVFATVRDLQYAALLGQFDAALIQLGDVGSSLYMNGIANTAKAITSKGTKGLTVDDFGLVNKVSAEMSNLDGVARILDGALTFSGFKAIDKFGKSTFLKAAWIKNTKLAQSNPQAIVDKYKNVFEGEIADLIADLQAKRVTDNTKLLLWNELADVQPIALSEMPAAYLNMKNGRILYSLKSFGLKQLDLVRRNIVMKAQRGQVAEAFEEALKYGAIMGISGGSVENARSFIRGGPEATVSMDDASFEALSKIFFMSKYTKEKFLQEGKYGSYAMNLIQPAAPSVLDTIGKSFDSVVFDQEVDFDSFNRTMRNIPVAGSAYYYGVGGGAEKLIERVEAEE